MARMIPGFCPGHAPPGEKAIYKALASDARTSAWTILHSLGLADHVRQTEGEADFVIFVPGSGALVLEVKSHRTLSVLDDGRWKLGQDSPAIRTPFQQANEAKHSIRKYLAAHNLRARDLPVFAAVWFTGLSARTRIPPSAEWQRWQILDADDLNNDPVESVNRTFDDALSHLEVSTSWFERGPLVCVPASVERAVNKLRPKFEIRQSADDVRKARTDELVHFVEEQFGALDAAADNRSVVFTGPAGSGKTFLAVESFRREASEGKSGRLLCFNRLLGQWLDQEIDPTRNTRVGSFHSFLLSLAGIRPPANPGTTFWNLELPERAADVLLASDEHVREFLILDEVQDLATDLYLDLMDLLVEGGLTNGRVLAFGDFTNQAIFAEADHLNLVLERCKAFSYRLSTNCRNVPRIGHTVNMVSQLTPKYKKFRREDDGFDPEFLPYGETTEQEDLLVDAVRRLKNEGFALNEITVLSPLRTGSVAESAEHEWLRQILVPISHSSPNNRRLPFGTIQAFKGLESRVVILTDLDQSNVPNFEALMYVGMTRATDRLVSIASLSTLRQLMEAHR